MEFLEVVSSSALERFDFVSADEMRMLWFWQGEPPVLIRKIPRFEEGQKFPGVFLGTRECNFLPKDSTPKSTIP